MLYFVCHVCFAMFDITDVVFSISKKEYTYILMLKIYFREGLGFENVTNLGHSVH